MSVIYIIILICTVSIIIFFVCKKMFPGTFFNFDSETNEIKNEINKLTEGYMQYPENKCVCVFDLDDTITCNKDIAKEAIKECKNNGCKIAINTARQLKYYEDIDTDYLGLDQEDLSNFYTGPIDVDYSIPNNNLHLKIAEKKVSNLDEIAFKFSVPKKKVILFDDNEHNIKMAEKHGYSIIHANNPACGLNYDVINNIRQICYQ